MAVNIHLLYPYFSERDAHEFFGACSEGQIQQVRDLIACMNDEQLLKFKQGLRSIEHLRNAEQALWTWRN